MAMEESGWVGPADSAETEVHDFLIAKGLHVVGATNGGRIAKFYIQGWHPELESFLQDAFPGVCPLRRIQGATGEETEIIEILPIRV